MTQSPRPKTQLLSHSEICEAIERLEAKVQYLLNATSFSETAALEEIGQLRSQLISEPPRDWITVASTASPNSLKLPRIFSVLVANPRLAPG
jgi:anti-sigma factor ChrR (cupin superfamily)